MQLLTEGQRTEGRRTATARVYWRQRC